MDQLIYAVENTNHKRQNNDADDEKISIENPVEKGMTIGAKPTLHTRKKSKTINTDIKENPQTNSTNIHVIPLVNKNGVTTAQVSLVSAASMTKKRKNSITDADIDREKNNEEDEEEEDDDGEGNEEDYGDEDDVGDDDEEDTSSTQPGSHQSISSNSSLKHHSSTMDPTVIREGFRKSNTTPSSSSSTGGGGGGEKMDRRRELNRMNAKKSRQRKKVFVDQLHDRLQEVEHNLSVIMTYVANVLHINPQDILNGTAPTTHQQPNNLPYGNNTSSTTTHHYHHHPSSHRNSNNNNSIHDTSSQQQYSSSTMSPFYQSNNNEYLASSTYSQHQSSKHNPSSPAYPLPNASSSISSSNSTIMNSPSSNYSQQASSDAKELLSFAQQNSTNHSSHSSSISSSGGSSTTTTNSNNNNPPSSFTMSKVPSGIAPPEPRLMQSASRSRDSFVMCDPSLPDVPIVWASPGFLHLTGYSYNEILGKNCRFLQCNDTDREVVKQLSNAIKDGREISCVLLNQRKDGTRFWNCLTMSPLYDNHHKVVAIIGIQVDVSTAATDKNGSSSSNSNSTTNSLTNNSNTVPTVPPTNNIESAQEHAQSLLATISAEAVKVAEAMGK